MQEASKATMNRRIPNREGEMVSQRLHLPTKKSQAHSP